MKERLYRDEDLMEKELIRIRGLLETESLREGLISGTHRQLVMVTGKDC